MPHQVTGRLFLVLETGLVLLGSLLVWSLLDVHKTCSSAHALGDGSTGLSLIGTMPCRGSHHQKLLLVAMILLVRESLLVTSGATHVEG